MEEELRKRTDLLNPDVLTKYKMAADIANRALALVVSRCAPGAPVWQLCELGDAFVADAASRVFTKKDARGRAVLRGVGFPTTVCPNACVANLAPGRDDPLALAAGDLVKVDLGVHIDGYLATAAHSFVLGAPAAGRAADAIAACYTAAECVARLVRPGFSTAAVTDAVGRAAAQFGCRAVAGTASRQMAQFQYLTHRFIPSREDADTEEKAEPFEFEPGQAYSVDVVVSTGEGVQVPSEARTTVFQRDQAVQYQLKTKVSRQFLKEVNHRFPFMPFCVARHFPDQAAARAGVAEGRRHGLLLDFPVTTERAGELVARLRFTLLLTQRGAARVTGLPLDPAALHTTSQIRDAELAALLATPMWSSGRGGRGGKKPVPGAVAVPDFRLEEEGEEGADDMEQ